MSFKSDKNNKKFINGADFEGIMGDLFHDKYAVLRLLGSGGQGQVYLVEEKDTGTKYAAKRITIDSWDELKPLETEVKALQQLNGGHIPRLHQYTVVESQFKTPEFVMVTEYISGKNFSEMMQDGKRFSEDELKNIRAQTLEALTEAHSKGIVHRDLKPSNIMMNEAGIVYVTDFGLAKFLGDATHMSSAGKGSIYYMAPEQLKGDAIGVETDYYQLGLTLIALASGRERSDDIRHEKPLEQLAKLTHWSAGFRSSLEKLVAEDVKMRWEGVGEVVETEMVKNVSSGNDLFFITANSLSGFGAGNITYLFCNESYSLSLRPEIGLLVSLGCGLAGAAGTYLYQKHQKKKRSSVPYVKEEGVVHTSTDVTIPIDSKRIEGKYVLMPHTPTYALGVEALRAIGKTPLTFKENIEARVNAYELGDRSLFDTWIDSSTGIAYKKRTTKFKIIPSCVELIGIEKDFNSNFLPIEYDTITGIELDSGSKIFSKSYKYGLLLTKAEILEHPGWRALVEDDKSLLRAYTDIVFAAYAEKHSKTDKLMRFWVQENKPTDELRAVFVNNLDNNSNANGYNSLNNNGRLLLRS